MWKCLQMQIICKADNGLKIKIDGKVKSWNDFRIYHLLFVFCLWWVLPASQNWNKNV